MLESFNKVRAQVGFAEIHVTSSFTLTIAEAGTYVKLAENFEAGQVRFMEVQSNSTEIVVPAKGVYETLAKVTFEGKNNNTYSFGVSINSNDPSTENSGEESSVSRVRNVVTVSLNNLLDGDVVSLRGANLDSTADATIRRAALSVKRMD